MKSKANRPIILRLLSGAVKTCGVCAGAYFLMIIINYISENRKSGSKKLGNSSSSKSFGKSNKSSKSTGFSEFSKIKLTPAYFSHNAKSASAKSDKDIKKAKNIEMSNTRNEIVKKIKEQNSADRQ